MTATTASWLVKMSMLATTGRATPPLSRAMAIAGSTSNAASAAQYARNDVAYLPMPCQHCQNAHCMKAAPDAITRRADGVVMIDQEKAKGKQGNCRFLPIWRHLLE